MTTFLWLTEEEARNVIGRRIVTVEQERFYDGTTSTWQITSQCIVLDDGTRLEFTTMKVSPAAKDT